MRPGMGLRGTTLIAAVALACLCAPERAPAQAYASTEHAAEPLPDTAARYGAVFDQWVARRDPNHAILVVRRDGRTVFAKGHGADPMKPS